MLHIYCSHTIHNNCVENTKNIEKLKIENLPDEDIICYVYGKEIIANDSEINIIEKFRRENVDILFGGEMICIPKYKERHDNLYKNNKLIAESQHKYASVIGYIGYKWAIYKCLCKNPTNLTDSFLENKENDMKDITMKIDTKTRIFLNMNKVDWKDIWFNNGQIYNRILEETPCLVNFNAYSWQTNKQENIIPICLDKLEKSLDIHLPLNINKYTSSYNTKKQFSIPCFQHTEETRRILSNLDGIVYINLDRRTDRRSEIEEELTRYGMNNWPQTERFSAINRPDKGIVGCTYSHLAVYKLAKERGYKNVLILEDDFVFIVKKKDVYENLRKLFDSQVQFDVCMLAYNNTQTALPTEYDFLLKTVEAQAASAYIVNESIYDRMIDLYEWAAPLLDETDEHWIYANDQIWKRLQNDPDIKWYCFKERIGKQQDGYSDNSQQFMELIEH